MVKKRLKNDSKSMPHTNLVEKKRARKEKSARIVTMSKRSEELRDFQASKANKDAVLEISTSIVEDIEEMREKQDLSSVSKEIEDVLHR